MKPEEHKAAPVTTSAKSHHPSRDLTSRSGGYGIAAGYEKKRTRDESGVREKRRMYGPLPHSGYYGAGIGARPFKAGQAGFSGELKWYHSQYGENTSGLKSSN
jgi:hypothetical protein